ncbi:MAG: spore photoproduct lyase [Desulfobacteraceae bacterium Eth-SRB1]|nr:MAG: spore photoproduct lyase [Desulfobacteraceae bacterium Eth-SRB1]
MPLLKLYIDQKVADSPWVVSIQSRLNLPLSIVQNAHEVFEAVSSANDPVQKGKEVLFLTQNKGAFIRDCPGTRYYTCCGYKILHIGTFCVMDCSYCILQSYFHPPVLQYFVNHDDLLAELDSLFAEKKLCRIGTGEFTDSMIWEMWTDLSDLLVPKFAGQSHSILELKTKTTAIDKLKHLNHNRKTIVSWSLNTNKVIQTEERNTSSLSARLKAAAKCESWGYKLAFHFDPMVIYDGCEEDYRKVINQLFSHISAKNIVWISLGTFRFMPSLKSIIQKRFPESKIIYGEFIPGMDGKMRYFKPLRINLYQKVVSWIKEIAPDVLIYYCMEDDEVWQKSLGFVPSDRGGLPLMLDNSAMQHCGLDVNKVLKVPKVY